MTAVVIIFLYGAPIIPGAAAAATATAAAAAISLRAIIVVP